MRYISLVLLFFFCNVSIAEIYRDFTPYLTLSQMKKNYPNATIEVVKAGWVQEKQTFLKLHGPGLPGATYLAFSYNDSFLENRVLELDQEIAATPDADHSKSLKYKENIQKIIDRPLEEKMVLDWVRWVPVARIPFERLKSRYGEPEKCDFSTEDYTPYCLWASKGVNAVLSDDKKEVFSIEYMFTEKEKNLALGIETSEEKPVEPAAPKAIKSKKKI